LAEPAPGYALFVVALVGSTNLRCFLLNAESKSQEPPAGSAMGRLPVVFKLQLLKRQSIMTRRR
jgi:hypothetical protein